MNMIRLALTAAALVASAAPALAQDIVPVAAADSATLTLHFANAKPGGQVMIAIFDAAGWQGGRPMRVALAPVQGDKAEAVIAGLTPGSYGVKAFEDVDGDGKMGTNPFGMPTEPFGFSGNAAGGRGAPAWDAAAFTLGAGANIQTITLR